MPRSPTPPAARPTPDLPASSPHRSLRTSTSASSLPRLPSTRTARGPQTSTPQPSLAALVQEEVRREQVEEEEEQQGQGRRPRRRSSAPLPGAGDAQEAVTGAATWTTADSAGSFDMPHLNRLLPPHYGRPGRPSSPDVLATLLRPVLASLSRPSSHPPSPASSPLITSPSSTHPSTPPPDLASTEPADRSSSSLPAHFPPRAPTDPAPTVESQGFVLYGGSAVAYAAYLVWAFVPGEWLEKAGIEWFPSQEWALLIPSWIVMLVAFTYSSYFFLNMYNTPPLSSLDLTFGEPGTKAFIAPPPRPLLADGSLGLDPLFFQAVGLEDDAIPPLYDLPLEWVNRVLYAEEEGGREKVSREKGS